MDNATPPQPALPNTKRVTGVRHKVLVSVLLIAAFLLIGGGIGAILYALRVTPPRRETPVLAPLVEFITVQPEDVVERFVGYGTVQAIRSADVAAEVAATVVQRVGDVRAGTAVTKGQVLIRLDHREYRHRLDHAAAQAQAQEAAIAERNASAESLKPLLRTAQSELRVAQEERQRVSELFERDLAAKKEYDFAILAYQRARRTLEGYQREAAMLEARKANLEASKRALEAEAALAQLQIDRCRVRVPFDGVVEAFLVDEGDRVAPGTVVLRVVDLARVEIPIQLAASVYDRTRVGAACRITIDSVVGHFWDGVVERIAPIADPGTRAFAVYVMVDNAPREHKLVPGSFVRAEVRGPTYVQSLLVPRRVCREGRVFVAEDGIVRERAVTTARFLEDRALVRGDLHAGDRVIVSHLTQLVEGAPVRLRSSESPEPGADVTTHANTATPEASP